MQAKSSTIATLSSVKKQQLPSTSASSQQQIQIHNASGSTLQGPPECSNSDSSSLANNSCGSNSSDQSQINLLEILEEKVSGYNSGDEHLGTKEHNLSTEEWTKRDEKFSKSLSERGLIIKEMEEDGACLFRAISYQLYGDQDMHDAIRQQTMDYIFQNREYFAQFITEGSDDGIILIRKNVITDSYSQISRFTLIENGKIICMETICESQALQN